MHCSSPFSGYDLSLLKWLKGRTIDIRLILMLISD